MIDLSLVRKVLSIDHAKALPMQSKRAAQARSIARLVKWVLSGQACDTDAHLQCPAAMQ